MISLNLYLSGNGILLYVGLNNKILNSNIGKTAW